jgi:hypothetical protein
MSIVSSDRSESNGVSIATETRNGPSTPEESNTVRQAEPFVSAEAGESQALPPSSLSFALLKSIVTEEASRYPAQPDKPLTWISIGVFTERATVPVQVPLENVGAFLNGCGRATVAALLVDVQFSFTNRTSKSITDHNEICGITVDVDKLCQDILAEVEKAGLPTPNLIFWTVNGYKLIYLFDPPASQVVAEELAMRATLAFEGGDSASWNMGQMQRMPTVLKTTESGVVKVVFDAIVTNAVPLKPIPTSVRFPWRVLEALGAGILSPSARRMIEDFLDERGIPAPDSAGSLLYAACPIADAHDTNCCYVNRDEDGCITVHCLGGHDGQGAKRWHEDDLAALAVVR